jgi:hypothetical protein
MTGVVNPRQSALEVPLCRHHFSRKLLALAGDRLRPIPSVTSVSLALRGNQLKTADINKTHWPRQEFQKSAKTRSMSGYLDSF